MDHSYFMRKALELAKISLSQGEFPVACVLVEDSRIVASGSRIGTLGNTANEIDHAEMTALKRFSQLPDPPGADRLTLYTTLEPCLMCFGALLINGIRKIVFAYEDAMGGGTRCDLSSLPALYNNLPIAIVPHILRTDSLLLFKSYFSNPRNRYLQKSFLSAYTLSR